jgi:hypothetical protein
MKIFGTGMQRTGTTSLAKALQHLGIATRDHPKDLFHDIDHPLIHEFDAFTDNPIPLLYRELDARHPGSKFIHTVRDEERWLASVEWLHTVGAEKFHWERVPEIEEMHRALYGTTTFDGLVFLETYRRHDREVRAYFAERPDDLLVLDVTAGEGFEKICPFLGLDPPKDPFPHWNRQERGWKVKLRELLGRLLR